VSCRRNSRRRRAQPAGRCADPEGARRPLQEQEGNWQRRERAYGTFSRAVQLPFRVDPDKVQARFNNGILEIENG
jgi:HSP20 family molecular chaperone IbpA